MAVAISLLFAAAPALAGAKLTVTPAHPTVGHAATVQLEEDGTALDPAACTLVPTYRPNSATRKAGKALSFDASGRLDFTPTAPGIVSLAATCGEKPVASVNVAVRFADVPRAGLAVMLVAGLVLFGGMFLAVYRSQRQ